METEDVDTQDVLCYAFPHQVGGHKCVLQVTEDLICKPCEESERLFYNNVPPSLQPYVPTYRGEVFVGCTDDGDRKTLHAKIPKSVLRSCRSCADGWRNREEINWSTSRLNHCIKTESLWKDNSTEKFIMFDNLLSNFERPCALDVKLCRYYHGICNDVNKRMVLEQKCNKSTSSSLGFRIGGMQLYQQDISKMVQFNKYYGMTINDGQAIDALRTFFVRSGTNLQDISNTIRNMQNAILHQDDYIFLSVSLLFFYDNSDIYVDSSSSDKKPEIDNTTSGRSRCKVRLIDFEKVVSTSEEKRLSLPRHIVDNINFGMTNLSNLIDQFAAENEIIKEC